MSKAKNLIRMIESLSGYSGYSGGEVNFEVGMYVGDVVPDFDGTMDICYKIVSINGNNVELTPVEYETERNRNGDYVAIPQLDKTDSTQRVRGVIIDNSYIKPSGMEVSLTPMHPEPYLVLES